VNNRVEAAGGLKGEKDRIIDIGISTRDEDIWRNPRWEQALQNPGRIRNVLFENIEVSTTESHFLRPCRIEGHDPSNSIESVVFRNFRVNGEAVTSATRQITIGDSGGTINFMEMDPQTTQGISFE
jgi:hypothetical protein